MTPTTPAVEEIIKTDVLGRMRTSPERRESLLAEFDQSGLSGKKFAELTGVKYQTLATWLQKRRQQNQTPAQGSGTVKWLEAVVEQAQNQGRQESPGLVLQWPGGARVELAEVKQIPLAAALVRELAKPC